MIKRSEKEYAGWKELKYELKAYKTYSMKSK
jgi:hypothetical protein